MLLRKPLLFLFVLATGASLISGGRLSLRLLVDTATALAPVVLIQVAAFAIVFFSGRRPVGFPVAVDTYFNDSGPWFAAIAVLGAFGAATSPIVASEWFTRVAAVVFLAAAAATARLDFAYFRFCLGRSPRRAAADLVVQRFVGWGATLTYLLFMSLAKASSFLPAVAANLFGARP